MLTGIQCCRRKEKKGAGVVVVVGGGGGQKKKSVANAITLIAFGLFYHCCVLDVTEVQHATRRASKDACHCVQPVLIIT